MALAGGTFGQRRVDESTLAFSASELDTVADDGGWPVLADLVPAVPPVESSGYDGDRTRKRSLGAIVVAGAGLIVILALGLGLVWALTRPTPVPPARTAAPAPAASSGLTMPRLVGENHATAERILARRGLRVELRKTPSSRPAGTVVVQSPSAGMHVRSGERVLVVVAAPTSAQLPNLVGLDAEQAVSVLRRAGLRVRLQAAVSDRPKNMVLRQLPTDVDQLARGGVVTLIVSRGRNTATVPPLLGRSSADASAVLRAAGFQVEVLRHASRKAAGTVIGQNPQTNASVDHGSVVRIEVAAGIRAAPPSDKVTMPKLTALSTTSAESQLRAVGLHATIQHAASPQPAGTVIGQKPMAGAQVRRGMTITIQVSSGPAMIDVPNVTGMDESSAQQQLENAGFQTQLTDETVTDPAQDGVVLDETPRTAPKGDTITLTIGQAE